MKIDLKVRFSTLVSLPSPISSGTSTGNRGVQMNPISYIILTAEKNAQKGLDFYRPLKSLLPLQQGFLVNLCISKNSYLKENPLLTASALCCVNPKVKLNSLDYQTNLKEFMGDNEYYEI